MSSEVLIKTNEFSRSTFNRAKQNVQAAINSANYNLSDVYYQQTGMNYSLYTSDIASQLSSVVTRLETVHSKLESYSAILATAPEEFSEIDKSCKNQVASWWDRTRYSAGQAVDSGLVKHLAIGAVSAVSPVVGFVAAHGKDSAKYWVDNYKKKGWVYKTIHTIGAIGKAVPAVVGCAATWAGTIASGGAGAPLAALSTIYTTNTVANAVSDIKNLWTENYDEVGKVNYLKDGLKDGFGDISEKITGSRKAGELVGKCVYSVGDVIVGITHASAISTQIKHQTPGSTLDTDFVQELKGKTHYDLPGQLRQSDMTFDTVKKAVSEFPAYVKDMWTVANEVPLKELRLQYSFVSGTYENIKEVTDNVKLLKEVADITGDVVNNVADIFNITIG